MASRIPFLDCCCRRRRSRDATAEPLLCVPEAGAKAARKTPLTDASGQPLDCEGCHINQVEADAVDPRLQACLTCDSDCKSRDTNAICRECREFRLPQHGCCYFCRKPLSFEAATQAQRDAMLEKKKAEQAESFKRDAEALLQVVLSEGPNAVHAWRRSEAGRWYRLQEGIWILRDYKLFSELQFRGTGRPKPFSIHAALRRLLQPQALHALQRDIAQPARSPFNLAQTMVFVADTRRDRVADLVQQELGQSFEQVFQTDILSEDDKQAWIDAIASALQRAS
eukprot:TRINITY_DN10811_c0_g1_i4.p1 TRINITY_DN10811_c0_g1~~TRINITY_DN10811_c0_g1_i4.p1  ORF type:complete len:299 (+),score=12.60 TRINITY_DN10811_c0_g1_i4:53-898(+)